MSEDHCAHSLPVGPEVSAELMISELFAQQFLPPDIPILFCHMKTVLVEGSTDITYLYK